MGILEEPPAYSLYEHYEGVSDPRIIDALERVVRNRRPPPTPEEARVKRLRRFLSFCLAIDYGLQKHWPDQLTKDDFCHFVRLSSICFELELKQRDGYCWSCPTEMFLHPTLWLSVTPEIETELVIPARELEIPPSYVIWMTKIFIESIRGPWDNPSYTSRLSDLPRTHNLRTFGEKLMMDYKFLFETILPCNLPFDVRIKLNLQNRISKYIYFSTLSRDHVELRWLGTVAEYRNGRKQERVAWKSKQELRKKVERDYERARAICWFLEMGQEELRGLSEKMLKKRVRVGKSLGLLGGDGDAYVVNKESKDSKNKRLRDWRDGWIISRSPGTESGEGGVDSVLDGVALD